jgi:CheY-like chemotaxis protein
MFPIGGVHKILIVDDDKATCDLLRSCLSEGYEVVDTQDPEQALGLALEHKPDAILLDLMMPKFSGFELCQSFRSLSYTSTIPVLVITGETGAQYKDRCKTIRKGGVLGSVLGEPEGAKKYDIRVEAFMAQPDATRLHQLADDVARGEFSIPIARTMKLQEIQEAHRIFERGGLAGKIVLVP